MVGGWLVIGWRLVGDCLVVVVGGGGTDGCCCLFFVFFLAAQVSIDCLDSLHAEHSTQTNVPIVAVLDRPNHVRRA